jgi:hypothetical protein
MLHGVKPIFYDAAKVRYVVYGNGGYGLDRFDAARVAAYNAAPIRRHGKARRNE